MAWVSIAMRTEMFFRALSSEMRKEVMAAITLHKEGSSNLSSVLLQLKSPRSSSLMALFILVSKRMAVVRVQVRLPTWMAALMTANGEMIRNKAWASFNTSIAPNM